MSDLDDAMEHHMAYIILSEHRPFSFRDFLMFTVDGEEYTMAEGTIRNKFSRLKKSGVIELEYNSGTAFYTLKGHRFERRMIPNHAGVNSSKIDSFVRLIQDLPMGNNGLHDIRLRFEARGVWKFMSTYHPELPTNHISKDILIPTYNIDNILVRVTVHKTDTISVSLACSLTPVSDDISGIISFSNALVRVEERVSALLVRSCNPLALGATMDQLWIPDHKTWIVTMWHFGADSLTEYSGEKFQVSWEVGRNTLVRAYTKIMNDKKTRIRLEGQRYPRKTFQAIVEEKIGL